MGRGSSSSPLVRPEGGRLLILPQRGDDLHRPSRYDLSSWKGGRRRRKSSIRSDPSSTGFLRGDGTTIRPSALHLDPAVLSDSPSSTESYESSSRKPWISTEGPKYRLPFSPKPFARSQTLVRPLHPLNAPSWEMLPTLFNSREDFSWHSEENSDSTDSDDDYRDDRFARPHPGTKTVWHPKSPVKEIISIERKKGKSHAIGSPRANLASAHRRKKLKSSTVCIPIVIRDGPREILKYLAVPKNLTVVLEAAPKGSETERSGGKAGERDEEKKTGNSGDEMTARQLPVLVAIVSCSVVVALSAIGFLLHALNAKQSEEDPRPRFELIGGKKDKKSRAKFDFRPKFRGSGGPD